MIGRRSFLAGILAAGAAPALVRAGMLMPVKTIQVPPSYLSIVLRGDDADFLDGMRLSQESINEFIQLLRPGQMITSFQRVSRTRAEVSITTRPYRPALQ